jgi:hypothetical protein
MSEQVRMLSTNGGMREAKRMAEEKLKKKRRS